MGEKMEITCGDSVKKINNQNMLLLPKTKRQTSKKI